MTRSGPALKKRACLLPGHHGPLAWALLLYIEPNPPLHGFACCLILKTQNSLWTALSPSFPSSSMACWLPPSSGSLCSPGWPSEWAFCLSLVCAGLTEVILLLLLYSDLTQTPGFNTHTHTHLTSSTLIVFHFLHFSSLSRRFMQEHFETHTHTHTTYGLSKIFIQTDLWGHVIWQMTITHVEQSIVYLEHSVP